MIHRSRLSLVLGLVVAASLVPSVVRGEDAPNGVIRVDFREIKNSTGKMVCFMWSSAEGFPKETNKAIAGPRAAAIQNKQALLEFDKVAAGVYAIGCFHDENLNGKIDTNFVGIPVEGHAASNDARGFMSPPSFADARFAYKGGPIKMRLKVSY